jgi:ribosomal protein S18 acetylase RimI-like enzyme
MIKRIKNIPEDIQLLSAFLNDAGNSLSTFRYFGKRPLECIQNHKYTILVLNENEGPVAYGHLDPQSEIVWLGICVSENQVGKGYGKMVMTNLTEKADSDGISELILQVDKANVNAVRLYKKFNFITTDDKEGLYLIMKRARNIE